MWVILCRLPEKGRKEIEEIVEEDEREGKEKKRNRNEREETEVIKTSPSTLPATGLELELNDTSALVDHFVSSPRER